MPCLTSPDGTLTLCRPNPGQPLTRFTEVVQLGGYGDEPLTTHRRTHQFPRALVYVAASHRDHPNGPNLDAEIQIR